MLPSHSGSFRLFRFAGIQVYLHWWWFVFAVFEMTMRKHAYASNLWNLAEYLTLFLIVLLHEFGHSLACRQTGGRADQIILWPLGGIAFVRPPPRPGAELWSIAAGPLVNVVLVPVIYGLHWAASYHGWTAASPDLGRFLVAVWWINAVLLGFNLLPVYPLDGGQILRSLLWFAIGRARSLIAATVLGFIGIAAIGGGLLWLNPNRWLVVLLMGAFLGQQCLAGFREAKAMLALTRQPRHSGVACPACGQPPPGGPMWRCGQCSQRFDPFSTRASCPHCGNTQARIPCPYCGSAHELGAWRL